MTEPVKAPLMRIDTGKKGGQPFADEQFWTWLEFMRPFLEMGNTIFYACNKAGIEPHYDTILIKYKAGGPFARKIDSYRAMPGELVNNTLVKLAKRISDKVNNDQGVNTDELNTLKLMAEKHRTSQPFFVNRQETGVADESKIGRILDTLEEQTDYDNLASEAERQMVAPNSPVQNQEQAGADNIVQAEHNPAQASGGAQGTPVQ